MTRISTAFEQARADARAVFVPFVMSGDPDGETTATLLDRLAEAGAGIIELGIAFTDPVADGPTIQRAGQRALKAGQTVRKTLDVVRSFRSRNHHTAIVLMGYFNPIHCYGAEAFVADAADAGVDGLIIVDLPPEEDASLALPARAAGLDWIRLATPTTNEERLERVIEQASGFIYYVSVAGITGAQAGSEDDVRTAVARIRERSGLPVAVGFGVRTPEQAAAYAQFADGVVVGSALVDMLASGEDREAAVEQTVSLAGAMACAMQVGRTPG